jgi:hypothetical protein
MQADGGDFSGHDSEIAEAMWVDLKDASSRASHKSEQELLIKAQAILLGLENPISPAKPRKGPY